MGHISNREEIEKRNVQHCPLRVLLVDNPGINRKPAYLIRPKYHVELLENPLPDIEAR